MIIKFSQLAFLRKSLCNKKIAFAGGCFDLFHRGYIEFFKNLRKFGDVVIVAVSTDKRVRQRKGPKRPILSERDRLALVDAIRYVDYVLLAPESNKQKPVPTMQILAQLRPDVFVSIDKRWLPLKKDIENLGATLKIIPRKNIHSTSRIIARILNRYC